MYSVLLVSNQNLMRDALKKIIEKNEKFSIFGETNSYNNAIDYVRNNNINLVFSDFIMPNITRVDFINKIEKANNKTKVLLVAFPHDLVFEGNENINLNQIILKPLTYEKVNEKLEEFDATNQKSYEKDFLFNMEQTVNMNDFIEVNEYLIGIINEFDFNSTDVKVKDEIKDKLKNLGNKIINFNSFAEDKDLLYKDFPISDLTVKDKRLCNIWMFRIINYYFKKKSVSNYPILKGVFKYIENNLNKNISLNDVVKECNISQGYLSRLFKNEYNLTVVNYIHLKKINLAKECILLEDSSVLDIAFNLGYNEYGYFSKVFKKYENMTVEQFKKAR
ncbi:two-component system, response regulator YesN [Peptoniphilus asaccharolyticus DSM 20463]|uniref:Two-component system, response regulator YesN n=1 Tax=Peptoniphilus asaccharolyticus DSM 20463 TaxID=573058 RepID=A0A1W1V4N1_PEPAS|nr:AraC family transcriptional regulator [Peptoniphilus asaccharolyticus]MBL7576332.1 AraC family transcriptional regulator [Peptoniphilus asaccharolyticus]SMB88359.1 two-component system, response regulator YesN [Peptoniphilus asaccharolyticus DSM 20463]